MANPRGRPPHPDVLTPAEWQVLEHVRAGRTNPEIAATLGVSVNTVRYHVSNILGKLGLADRIALQAWDGQPACRRGWFWATPAALTSGAARFGIAATGALLVAAVLLAANELGSPDSLPTPTEETQTSAAQPSEPTPTSTPRPAATAVPAFDEVMSNLVYVCIVEDEDTWPRAEEPALPPGQSSAVWGQPHRVSPDGCIRTLPALELAERRSVSPAGTSQPVAPELQRYLRASCRIWLGRATSPSDPPLTVELLNPRSEGYPDALYRVVHPQPDQLVFAACNAHVASVDRYDNESTRRWLPAD